MSATTLPLRTDAAPHYTFATDLDGATYFIELRWNEREGTWYLSISDSTEALIVAGVRLVLDYPTLARFTDARLPPGELFLVDTTGAGVEAALADLGSRVVLVYFSADEFA